MQISIATHYVLLILSQKNIYTGMFVHISGCNSLQTVPVFSNQIRVPLFYQHDCQNVVTPIC